MNNRALGSEYEEMAAQFLAKKGYQILQKNFRCKSGEIDLIAEHEGTLVFVEVKFRKNTMFGSPFEAVGHTKQRKICQTARYYLLKNKYSEQYSCRFDVIGIIGKQKEVQIEHIENAFMFL